MRLHTIGTLILVAAVSCGRTEQEPSALSLLPTLKPSDAAPPRNITRSSATPSQGTLETHALTWGKKKPHNGTEICNITQVIPCAQLANVKYYAVKINGSIPCRFSCYYDPSQLSPLRFEVHQQYHLPRQDPTFISVQQDFYISSWTLPIIFPVMGEDQKFTSLETLLCPPENEKNETVNFSISKRGPDVKELNIALHNVSFILQKDVNVSVIVSPVSPWYKRYMWAPSEESVLITAQSETEVCALLIIQNAKCPVSSEVSGLIDRGRYQSFTKQAGMVARKTDFPDGVHAIVISLPDDDLCMLNPTAASHNKTSGRKKTVVLEVYNHATMETTWYIFLMTFIAITVLVVAATVVILFTITRTLSNPPSAAEDRRHLMGGSNEQLTCSVEIRGYAVGVRQNREYNLPSHLGNNTSQNDLRGEGGGLGHRDGRENAGSTENFGQLALEDPEAVQGAPHNEDRPHLSIQPLPTAFPPSTYAPQKEALRLTNSFNPTYVWWWKSVAVYEAKTADAQVSEVGFQNSMVIMGVFAALPMSELLRSYISMVLHHGQEDLCFWNSRCLTAFASLPDFSRVFSNIGYIFLGIAFVIIIRRHRTLTHNSLNGLTEKNSVGVNHHYGLYASLGYGLIMQGVMSALYHTCPNSVTIKFDMMFMYVIMVVAVVIIWGLRHGDVTHHVYPTVITVGVALAMAEARMWLSRGWFWGIFTSIYGVILASNAVSMATYGIWSFSLPKLWQAWSGWREAWRTVRNILEEQNTSSQPMKVVRVMVGVGSNIALMLFGILSDPNFYYFILIVCLVNVGFYFANYVLSKRLVFKEKGTVLGWTCLGLSCLLVVIALVFFFHKRTDSESSPADSRAKNSPCTFLYVFDDHDIWHVTSAFALFFFFVALLTMDDDQAFKLAQKIKVA